MPPSQTLTPRPTFQEIYMRLAHSFAERSTCSRRKIGCVITSEDFRQVLAVGYNGNAGGLANACDRPTESGNCGCLHAEDNAVINSGAPRSTPKVVFVTTAPCPMCAKRLVNLGNVKRIYFAAEYNSATGLKILTDCGIPVERLIVE